MSNVVGRSSLVVGETDVPGGIKPASGAVRCVVALTAYVTAAAAIPVLLPAIISMVSIAGVVLAKRYPRRARHLMWFGVAANSLWMIPFNVSYLRASLMTGASDPKTIVAIAATTAVVIACDVMLIADAVGQRRTTNDERRS
ncbi:MAG TPA: hypothetical protein VFM77_18710 [Terriglobales bacterium]|nr:hypothetical protein [Terriglobales bacterium]